MRDCGARARSLSEEVRWLRFAVDGAQAQNAALKAKLAKRIAEKNTPSRPIAGVQLRTALRRSRRQKETIKSQSLEIRRLRRAVRASERLELQVPKLRAARTAVSKSLSDQVAALRRALRRSRRQKATIKSLREDNARLRRGAKTSRNRVETLEAELAKLRATGAVLSRTLYGRKSEKQETPRTGRPRGQQRGAPGHGRTQRPGLEERTEEHNPPADACVCARCGQPYAPNGARGIHPRRDRGQGPQARDPSSTLAPELRLRVVAYGSVGATGATAVHQHTLRDQLLGALFVRARCLLPPRESRRSAWMSGQGLVVSPGTLANSAGSMSGPWRCASVPSTAATRWGRENDVEGVVAPETSGSSLEQLRRRPFEPVSIFPTTGPLGDPWRGVRFLGPSCAVLDASPRKQEDSRGGGDRRSVGPTCAGILSRAFAGGGSFAETASTRRG